MIAEGWKEDSTEELRQSFEVKQESSVKEDRKSIFFTREQGGLTMEKDDI